MGNRRRSRELTLQSLYAIEFGDVSLDEEITNMRQRASELPSDDEDLAQLVHGDADVQDFAERLLRGVISEKEAIDSILSKCSTNWRVPRMALVDRNILRLATYELHYLPEIPPRVTMNEAIEIAKRYGSVESSAFVNGILDRIATAAKG